MAAAGMGLEGQLRSNEAALLRSREQRTETVYKKQSSFLVSSHIRSNLGTLMLLGLLWGNYVIFRQYFHAIASALLFSIAMYDIRMHCLVLWRFTKDSVIKLGKSQPLAFLVGAALVGVFAMLPGLGLGEYSTAVGALMDALAGVSSLCTTVVVVFLVLLALSKCMDEQSFTTAAMIIIFLVVSVAMSLFFTVMCTYEIVAGITAMRDLLLSLSKDPKVDAFIQEQLDTIMETAKDVPAQLRDIVSTNVANDTKLSGMLHEYLGDVETALDTATTEGANGTLDASRLAAIFSNFSADHSLSELGTSMWGAAQDQDGAMDKIKEMAAGSLINSWSVVNWVVSKLLSAVDFLLQSLIFLTVTMSFLNNSDSVKPHEMLINCMCLSAATTHSLGAKVQNVVESAIHTPFMCASLMSLTTLIVFEVFQVAFGFHMLPFIATGLTFICCIVPILPAYAVSIPWVIGIAISGKSMCMVLAPGLFAIQFMAYGQITGYIYALEQANNNTNPYFTALAIALGFQHMGTLGIFYGPLMLSTLSVILLSGTSALKQTSVETTVS